MLANNNSKVIDRMARRSLASNRRRNAIMIIAVSLSAFMLFGVLTVGVTYFKMQRIQNIRLNGAEFDAILYGLTDEQKEMCENNPDMKTVGIAAVAGFAIETEKDSTPNVGFIWADDAYWNEMMEPAREKVQGSYPEKANEVMVTREALKECGYENLGVGDSFVMTFGDSLGEHTREFCISGIWEGFGAKRVFYVSEAFYEESGKELSDVSSGRYYMDFKQTIMTQEEQTAFTESMNLEKQQRLFFTADLGYSMEILGGILGLIFVTCLCAYLLIYNIMRLSVSGNIRYYGLLQTVGMTGKQICRFMRRQMLFIGSIGTAGGILLGSGVSFFLIPAIIGSLGIRGQGLEVEIAFHPAIFLLTILIAALTVYIGSRKPVKMAVSISPIEALGYRAISGKKSMRKTGSGQLPWRMAKEQMAKDKKKTGIVIVSLAVSLSVFLCLVTLIESQGARTIVSNYMDMDMMIKNDTMKKEDRNKWAQILDEKMLAAVSQNQGVKEAHPMLCAEITVPWEPEFSDVWMREFYEMWMSIPYEDDIDEYKAYPENFGSFLVGIDEVEFDYLNSVLESPVDKEAFLEGKTCVLFRNSLDFKTSDLLGKQVTCAAYGDSANQRTFEIGGLTDEKYYSGALIGFPPTIIVSDSVVKGLLPNPLIYKVGVQYEQEYDENAEAAMLAAMQASPSKKDFSYESKIEQVETVKKAQGNMMEVGIGIVLILAFIGILNYVNTVTGNIQQRQVELSILESVGMTERQINRMLMMEGLLFAGGSLLLAMTLGGGVTYLLFQSMNYRGVPFSIPALPMIGMIIFIVLVCTAVPLLNRYLLAKRGSIVERIRGFE